MSDSDSEEAYDEPMNIFDNYVTLGKSSDFETVIWRFPNTDQCPLKDCMLSCSSRKNCLAHFHMHHAEICMVCTICNEIFLVVNPLHLLRHYQIHHPKERPPKLKETEDFKTSGKKAENSHKYSHKNGNDNDYQITTSGCGQSTSWIFPNVTECPNAGCKLKFKSRSKTMVHFRDHHAKQSIYCFLCSKPISTRQRKDFIQHYNRVHPNAKIPYDFDEMETSTQVCRTQKTRSRARPKIENGSNDRNNEDDDGDDFIALHSCGITTKWRYPKNQRDCIVSNCHQKFQSKSEGIAHYKRYHAIGSILCELCDRPIRSSTGLKDFRRHYANKHKNATVPYNFENESRRLKSENVQVKQERHDEDDLIQLKYGEWRFPDTTCCPVIGCRMRFDSRPDAIIHYKQRHAIHSVLCQFCNKPIRIDIQCDGFAKHFRNMHPDQEIPYGLGKRTNRSTDQVFHAEKRTREDHSDDLILLSACGQITEYQFPKAAKQCPLRNCQLKFRTRSDCIAHYKDMHAEGSILCPLCNKPIQSKKPAQFQIHWNRMHPNKPIPYDFATERNRSDAQLREDDDLITLTAGSRVTHWRFPKENWKRCHQRLCNLKFETRLDAINHYKSEHSNNAICCKLCDKPIVVYGITYFKKHYARVHRNVKFPVEIGLEAGDSQISRSPLLQIKRELQDDDDDDDLITLTTCGITTQWKYPKDCKVCPVMNCRQKFFSRSSGIEHYKQCHASGSICCPVCDQPVRSSQSLYDFHKHFKNKHPRMKVPFEASMTDKHQTHETVQNDDIIILTGLGQRNEWKVPKDFIRCPIQRCDVSSRDRAVLVAHFRKNHAHHVVFCDLCRKPISAWSRSHVYKHYASMHPNIDVPFIESSSHSERIMQLKMEIDSSVVCDLCNVRIQPEDMDQHLNEVHSTHRIYCPLKRCSYVAKQMNEMHTHWKRGHKGVEFPEFRDETNFTYVIDTSNHDIDDHIDDHGDNPTNVKIRPNLIKPTKSVPNGEGSSKASALQRQSVNISSDDESSVMADNPYEQLETWTVPNDSNKRRKSTDSSSAWFTGNETSNDTYVNDEPNAKRRKESVTYSKTNGSKGHKSLGTSSSGSSTEKASISENHMNKSRKVAKERMYSYSDDSIYGINSSKPITADNPISLDAVKECSIVLERLDASQICNLKSTTSSTLNESRDSLVHRERSTSTSSNEVIYIADSDEETATYSNGPTNAAETSSSNSIHVRRMSELMMDL